MTEIEEWRPIEGYEGLYEVSNLGRVKSLERITSYGRHKKEMILSPRVNNKGYFRVQLYKEGNGKMFFVHRLVAHAFIPNPEGLPQINHKDENPKNNRADNLEWCDQKYNNIYGTRIERQVQTRISNGNADPEMCGITEKERNRLRYQKNLEKMREYQREHQREYRRRKKQKQTT